MERIDKRDYFNFLIAVLVNQAKKQGGRGQLGGRGGRGHFSHTKALRFATANQKARQTTLERKHLTQELQMVSIMSMLLWPAFLSCASMHVQISTFTVLNALIEIDSHFILELFHCVN